VLYELPLVVETEDVDASPVSIVWPLLVAVQDHILLFSDNSSELDTLARVLPHRTVEVFNESLLPSATVGLST
jgi:hypothetical protein